MWLLILGVIVLVLKLLEFPEQMVQLSWWWVSAPFIGAAIWFEIFERRLGWDKKKAFDELQRAKEERIKKAMHRDKHVRLRR